MFGLLQSEHFSSTCVFILGFSFILVWLLWCQLIYITLTHIVQNILSGTIPALHCSYQTMPNTSSPFQYPSASLFWELFFFLIRGLPNDISSFLILLLTFAEWIRFPASHWDLLWLVLLSASGMWIMMKLEIARSFSSDC